MRWHKWVVRGLVFSSMIGMAAAALVYQRWTDPAMVRRQVIAALEQQFPGAEVSLEAARLRLLGGILLTELRLMRRDDLSRSDLVYIPSAVLYHDKERLLEGVLALRKVELHRPRIRIVRESDGRWNFTGLTGTAAAGPTGPIPTVVINEGTILLEDRLTESPLPPLEISSVKLTLINDPMPTVRIEGSGVSNPLGRINLQGTLQRDTGQVTLALQVADTHLNPALVQRLAPFVPKEFFKDLEIKGSADFQLDLDYQPDKSQPLDYDARCQVRQCFLRHPSLPLPLDQLRLEARSHNGEFQIDKASAVSGATQLTATARTKLPDWQQDLECSLTAKNLPLCKELCQRFPVEVQNIHQLFIPSGPAYLKLDLQKQKGKWRKQHLRLEPQNVDVCFLHFPYTVPAVAGWLDADLLTNFVELDLSSTVLPVTLTGTWQGGEKEKADLHLRANRIALDEKLFQALPPVLCDLAHSFHARGWGELQAHISRLPGAEDFANSFQVRLFDSSVKWDQFPYPLDKVSGILHINPHNFKLENFHGQHKGGTVSVSGTSIPWVHGDQPNLSRMLLNIKGQNMAIDADLRKALINLPNLGKAWDTMGPSGQLNFHARIDQMPDRPQDLEIALQVQGCRLEPVFFRYPLSDLSGYFSFRHNRLQLKNVQARHGGTQLAIGKGTVDLSPQGGFFANLEEVQGNPIYPDDGLVQALPPTLQRVFTALNCRDPLVIQTQLIIAQSEEPGSRPDLYWKGRAWLNDVSLQTGVELQKVTGVVGCVGRYDGQQLHGLNGNILLSRATVFNQPLENVHCNLMIRKETPDVLVLDLQAPLYGGDISGEARLDLNSTLRYEMNLTAAQLDLHRFGEYHLKDRTNLQGKASARLHVTGQGNSIATLNGDGSIHVAHGAKLYNLPFLLDLLKFLGLRWPDRTAFEEAHAEYSIHGNRLTVNRLDLWGSAISVTGHGDVNLDGTDVKLDFYPSWARLEQLLPPALRNVSPAISKNLLKIEVRGKINGNADDLKFLKRPVPVLIDPLVEIHNRMTGVQRNAPQAGVGAMPKKE